MVGSDTIVLSRSPAAAAAGAVGARCSGSATAITTEPLGEQVIGGEGESLSPAPRYDGDGTATGERSDLGR